MKPILYLDIISGISGDMFLGAMVDLGADPKALQEQLDKLDIPIGQLRVSRQQRGRISGTKLDVDLASTRGGHSHGEHGHHGHNHHHHGNEVTHAHPPEETAHGHGHGRTYADIRQLLEGSHLEPWVRDKALAVFHRVALAEGKIHGEPPEQVHFHEVGALDSIADIVAGCAALDLLGRPRVLSSAVTDGKGIIQCAHGQFPVPAPATLEILAARGVTVQQCDEPHELVTPTGAALVAEFAESFGPMPLLKPVRIGYGLGTRENKTRPNVLRAILGQEIQSGQGHDWEIDTVTVLETNLDDLSPEILGGFVDKALAAGALDVFYTPIQMKKSRPGVLLSILCETGAGDRFAEMVLRETSAFGVRCYTTERRKLQREIVRVRTVYGEVAIKVGRLDGRVVQLAPEYESCRQLADAAGVPLKTIFEAAVKAADL